MKRAICKEVELSFILGLTLSCLVFTSVQAQVGGFNTLNEYCTIDGSNNPVPMCSNNCPT